MELDRIIRERLKAPEKVLGPMVNTSVVKDHRGLEPSNFISPTTSQPRSGN